MHFVGSLQLKFHYIFDSYGDFIVFDLWVSPLNLSTLQLISQQKHVVTSLIHLFKSIWLRRKLFMMLFFWRELHIKHSWGPSKTVGKVSDANQSKIIIGKLSLCFANPKLSSAYSQMLFNPPKFLNNAEHNSYMWNGCRTITKHTSRKVSNGN